MRTARLTLSAANGKVRVRARVGVCAFGFRSKSANIKLAVSEANELFRETGNSAIDKFFEIYISLAAH